MKKLNLEQMEAINGSKLRLACIGQVGSGMEVLGSVALLLTVSNPIGWGLLALGAIGLAATAASDPYACD